MEGRTLNAERVDGCFTNIINTFCAKIIIVYLEDLKSLTIAYISEAPAEDKHAWSGTVHYVYKALQHQGYKVVPLGPARPGLIRIFLAGLNQLSLLTFKKRIDYRHSILYSKAFASVFGRKLKTIAHDLVVVCGNTECGAYLQTNKPVYYVLDRTIQGALNYHTILSKLWKFSENESIYTDRLAMKQSSKLFFSSKWAADHAQKFYGISDDKIIIQPFGANLDSVPSREETRLQSQPPQWKLLLVGTYWINKGADIACNALKILRAQGMNVTLTVVGCEPPAPISDPHLTVIPFIDKNSESGRRELWELFSTHHFFILPTRFDCTPIVFCEASAFALPVLSSDTGGVRGHIKENVNGFLVPYEDRGAGYAAIIQKLINNFDDYQKLRESTRMYYEDFLNWSKWGEKFTEVVKSEGLLPESSDQTFN